MNCDLIFSLN